jgi:hypothetical protein
MPKPRRNRERIFFEHHAEEATEEAGGLGAVGYGLTESEEARDLQWAQNIDRIDQRQVKPTRDEQEALLFRYCDSDGISDDGSFNVSHIRGWYELRPWAEVGQLMTNPVTADRAKYLARQCARKAGWGFEDFYRWP